MDIALERTFYPTFFEETTGLVSIWNELAGRSTTMPSDVPLIITNLLDLESRELFRNGGHGDVLQHIVLSLKCLPLSIFFNNWPRKDQNGNHQNRWVPVEDSKDRLTMDHVTKVRPSDILYPHRGGGVSAYNVNAIVSLESKTYLFSESEGICCYTVEPSVSSTDHFDTEGFTSICIMVENTGLPESSGTKHGACLFVQDPTGIKPPSVWHWCEQVLQNLRSFPMRIVPPGGEMTFICPIQLQEIFDRECLIRDPNHTYAINPVKAPHDIRINYGIFDH